MAKRSMSVRRLKHIKYILKITPFKGIKGKWRHVYVWLSSFAVHLKLSHIVNQLYPNKIKSAKENKYPLWIQVSKTNPRFMIHRKGS